METYRQVVPMNLPNLTTLLIDAGADVNALAGMYGGNCTPLALVVTSSHPAEAGVADDVVKILVAAGANTNQS